MEYLLSHLQRIEIAHNDLHRSNALVPGRQLFLIDFSGTLSFPSYLRWMGFAWLHHRDRDHAYKLAARCGADIQAPENPMWLRAVQRVALDL